MADFHRPEVDTYDDFKSNKRQRIERPSPESNTQHGHTQRPYRRGGYRPSRGRPGRSNHNSRRSAPRTTADPDDEAESHAISSSKSDLQDGSQKRNHKSKRDRKENPSTKIRSLRNQIRHGSLPPPIQAEKERELSALLYEREKKKLMQESRRNLQRYHFIRFMEKQKAQRTIKALRKQEEAGHEHDNDGRDIKERLKELEIDLNYTIYAPLGEKYISIFAEQRHGTQVSKAEKYKGNWKMFTPDERKFISEEQVDELQKKSMDAANILEIFGNTPDGSGTDGDREPFKPPIWYEVRDAMQQGSEKLEQLRDRMQGKKEGQDLVVGLTAGNKRKASWLDDNGEIDPADLDSASDEDMDNTGSHTKAALKRKADIGDDGNDDDMSDGDGGFFERR